MTFGRKGLLRRQQIMKKFKYTGAEAFIANTFQLVPGQVIDGGHPAVTFGVPYLVEVGESEVSDLVEEPVEGEESSDGEESFSAESTDTDQVISAEFGSE